MTTKNPTLLNISETAQEKLKEILEEQGTPDAYLRITLAPGGHGGAQYILGLEEDAEVDDTIVDSGAVKVLVDSDSTALIEGTSIDYVENMQRSGFVISNPNMASAGGCACGGQGHQAEGGHGDAGGCACGGQGHQAEGGHGGGGCACGGH